jgi:hypothetical protein
MQRVDVDGGYSDSRNKHGGTACAGINGFRAFPYVVGRARRYDSLGKEPRWRVLATAGVAARSPQRKHATCKRVVPGMESKTNREQAPCSETKTCDVLGPLDTTLSGATREIIFLVTLSPLSPLFM